jgi:transcriptional regulator with XRE-family HTH domain
MAINPLAITIRAKKLGVLIRDARTAHRKSVDECARTMGIPVATFETYELGEHSPSLPELELLAYSLSMSLDHFWGRTAISESEGPSYKADPRQIVELRQRIIGVMIRKARLESNLSPEMLAEEAGIAKEKVEPYELGEMPIPLPELEALGATLSTSLRDYQDHHSPVGVWFTKQQAVENFLELSPELQSFVCKPVNLPYIELAQRLSEMSVERLRAVAEGLLEITL